MDARVLQDRDGSRPGLSLKDPVKLLLRQCRAENG